MASPASVLYEDPFYKVTPATLSVGGVTYPLRNVANVVVPIQQPLMLKSDLINIVIALGGLIAFFQFSVGWMIAGLIAMGIGGFNVRSEFHRPWMVFVTMTDGTEIKLQRQDQEATNQIYAALRAAIG
jgi:hypothetical protein